MIEGNFSNTVKKLTGDQFKDLSKAITAAFPREEALVQMLRYQLDELLNNIPQAETYSGLIDNVVQWAETNGKLRDLVIGASLENPGNPQLQQFVQEHLQILLEVGSNPSSNLLSSAALALLIQHLQKITDFKSIVLPACTETLPYLDGEDYREEKEKLTKKLIPNKLSVSVKWLILLQLFLKTDIRNSENELYIIKFVQILQCLAVNASKSALNTWLTELPEELQPTQTVSKQFGNQIRPSNEALKNLQAYFLITVEYPAITTQTGKFGINGYLISRVGNDLTKFQALTLQSPPDDTSTQTIEEKQQKKGLFCTLQQIEHCLPDWLLQVQKVIANRCTELQTEFSLDFPPVYDLTIEFWLPFEHLAAAADTWKVYCKPVHLKRRNLVVGKEYRVVVRSYDRFSDPDALNKLNRTWQNLNDFLQKPSDKASVQQKFEYVDCWERLTAIQKELVNPSLLGLTLTCPLCLDQYQEQRENLFAWILEAGIPMALWSRCSDLADLQEKMHELLTAETLCQFDQLLEEQLLEQIKNTRKLANDEQHLGHHLAIWCDEPKRLIELKQFLETGRLSA
jgi:hypothetical protein